MSSRACFLKWSILSFTLWVIKRWTKPYPSTIAQFVNQNPPLFEGYFSGVCKTQNTPMLGKQKVICCLLVIFMFYNVYTPISHPFNWIIILRVYLNTSDSSCPELSFWWLFHLLTFLCTINLMQCSYWEYLIWNWFN